MPDVYLEEQNQENFCRNGRNLEWIKIRKKQKLYAYIVIQYEQSIVLSTYIPSVSPLKHLVLAGCSACMRNQNLEWTKSGICSRHFRFQILSFPDFAFPGITFREYMLAPLFSNYPNGKISAKIQRLRPCMRKLMYILLYTASDEEPFVRHENDEN